MSARDPQLTPFDDAGDRRLHAALRNLPELEAPPSLVPGVLAAIRARELATNANVAWYRRPATTWSPVARIALGVAALALLGAILLGAQLLWPSLAAVSDTHELGATASKFASLLSAARALAEAGALVLRNAISPLVIAAIGAALLSYLALLGIGSALWRATLQPRDQ
jgi:hypothetical protein